jgi:hypothetical protein
MAREHYTMFACTYTVETIKFQKSIPVFFKKMTVDGPPPRKEVKTKRA